MNTLSQTKRRPSTEEKQAPIKNILLKKYLDAYINPIDKIKFNVSKQVNLIYENDHSSDELKELIKTTYYEKQWNILYHGIIQLISKLKQYDPNFELKITKELLSLSTYLAFTNHIETQNFFKNEEIVNQLIDICKEHNVDKSLIMILNKILNKDKSTTK